MAKPYKRENPHAHCVQKPGRRLLHGVVLEFVRRKVSGSGQRPINASLNLTSYIDFLLVTVIFLLMLFSASGAPGLDRNITLPRAKNVETLNDAPVVTVNGHQVLVDGTLVASTRNIEAEQRMLKIGELFDVLRAKRELWESFHPRTEFPGSCILQVDADVSSVVVKSVFQTAAYAGYPNVGFMVRQRS